jgi:peptide/nickel transport system permease protein
LKAGIAILAALAALALAGPLFLSQSPLAQHRDHVLEPPGISPPADGTARHVLGTDGLGRDVLSRTLSAMRFTLATAIAGSLLTLALGAAFGAVAGLLGGAWDRLLMRASELFMALPALYLILGLRNLFPDSLTPLASGAIVVVSLAAVGWSGIARIVRGQVLGIREQDYVSAARAAGATRSRLLRVHVLPALRPLLLLQLGLHLPYFLLGEVTLSFLGLGLSEPDPSFGNMLASAASSGSLLGRHWWTWLAPAALLTLAVLGANLLLEGLRERYAARLGSEAEIGSPRSTLSSWATSMSRFWSSSRGGSGWSGRHRLQSRV